MPRVVVLDVSFVLQAMNALLLSANDVCAAYHDKKFMLDTHTIETMLAAQSTRRSARVRKSSAMSSKTAQTHMTLH
ncbi:MAG: hypothetical protein K2P58_04995 [Hyphomonadaceae bacterium]|nr:hypothetical protein [Hyphomonadaceae bacterium]